MLGHWQLQCGVGKELFLDRLPVPAGDMVQGRSRRTWLLRIRMKVYRWAQKEGKTQPKSEWSLDIRKGCLFKSSLEADFYPISSRHPYPLFEQHLTWQTLLVKYQTCSLYSIRVYIQIKYIHEILCVVLESPTSHAWTSLNHLYTCAFLKPRTVLDSIICSWKIGKKRVI